MFHLTSCQVPWTVSRFVVGGGAVGEEFYPEATPQLCPPIFEIKHDRSGRIQFRRRDQDMGGLSQQYPVLSFRIAWWHRWTGGVREVQSQWPSLGRGWQIRGDHFVAHEWHSLG